MKFLHFFPAIVIYIPYFCTFCMHLTFILIILSLIFSGRFNVCFTVSFKVSNIPFPNLSILCNLTFYNMLLNNNLGNLWVQINSCFLKFFLLWVYISLNIFPTKGKFVLLYVYLISIFVSQHCGCKTEQSQIFV